MCGIREFWSQTEPPPPPTPASRSSFSDLINGEADCLQVESLFAEFAAVLLREGHDNAALTITVSVLQLQLKLRVCPEGV